MEKFVPFEKLSKKKQKALNDQKRGDWGNVNPATQVLPDKKKYSREHMLLLVFIYYFKNMLSFHDIEALFAPITEGHFMDASGLSLQDIYEEVFSMEYEQMKRLKEDLLRKFHASEESFTDQKEDKDYLQLFTFICALGFDVFLKKQAMEMLIDQIREDYPVDHSKKKKS